MKVFVKRISSFLVIVCLMLISVFYVTHVNAAEEEFDLTTATHTSATASQVVWQGTNTTITSNRNGNSNTAVNNYLGGGVSNTGQIYAHTRFYNNNSVDFEVSAGYCISQIIITATSSSYLNGFSNPSYSVGEKSPSGAVLTVTVPTAPEGHQKVSVTISGGTTRITSIKIVYETQTVTTYTVTYNVDGATYQTDTDITYDSLLTAPTAPTKDGYTFLGWFDANDKEWDFTTDKVKDNLVLTAKWLSNELTDMVDSLNQINSYFGLAYKYSATTALTTDVLTADSLGLAGYADFADKTGGSTAVYSGHAMKSDRGAIQMRTNDNKSGIVMTAGVGNVKKVSVVWNSSTSSGRNLDIYGSNTPYTQATALYNSSNQGTLLGTITYGSGTELIITGDYKYIGMRSRSSALYLDSVSIELDASEYTDVEFRFRCGTDDMTTLVNSLDATKVTGYGLEVSDGTTTVNYAYDETTLKDDSIFYKIISLGDVLNNPERVEVEFTIKAYIIYDGTKYTSTASKTYSVKTLLKTYYDDANTKEAVTGLYNLLESLGYNFGA